jgi:signal transduction histidine kinase
VRIPVPPHAPAIAGAVLGLAALAQLPLRDSVPVSSSTPPTRGAYLIVLVLLALATTVPVALRPPAVAAVPVTLACVASLALFQTLTLAGIVAQLVVAYRFSRGGWALLLGVPYLALALAWAGAVSVGSGAVGPAGPPHGVPPGPAAIALAGLVPLAAGAGIARLVRREGAANQAARHAIAGSVLEHTARAERARIARELHDVVAHHISMVVVQAENARVTTPGMPAAGAQRLSAIGDTARAALTEMRRLLGVLRSDSRAAQPAPADRAADRRPQPGLRELNELLDEAREASGAGTRLILRGSPVALDPGVELAAYRIVQEALTNSRRHAPGAAVDVELHFTGTALRVLIRDNGPGVSTVESSGGHGLLGMRERAVAVGGTLRTGAAGAGGFLVEATLPVDAR